MRKLLLGLVASTVLLGAGAAAAGPVTAALGIQYFKVTEGGSDPDFPGSFPTVAAGSHLGTNGAPIATGVSDLTAGDSELTWWSPSLNSHVTTDGTAIAALPFAQNMYFPHGTGADDGTFFETALLSGNFNLGSASTITFNVQSDDDAFVYVDGTLIGQNPGIHGVTGANFTSDSLGVGGHNIEIFYADRENTGAFLSVSLVSEGITVTPGGVPEPATWGLMVVGFGGLGAMMRRRRSVALAA
jgi:hypothetical protein